MPNRELMSRAEAVVDAVVSDVLGSRSRAVQVEAPPGAGKSRLVIELMVEAMVQRASMLVAVQTNAQAIDLVRAMANRLAADGSTDVFGFWPSGAAKNEYEAEINWLRGHPNVDVCEKSVDANNGPDVVVAVARKWAFHNASSRPFLAITRRFDIGVVDEAFQMRAAELMRFGDLVDQVVLVGDPGQLEPFTPIDSERWLGLEASPLTPSPDAVRAFLGGSAVNSFALPASFRLDHRAAPVVSECFYPRLSFDAVAQAGERELGLDPGGADVVDRTLDLAAGTGWARLGLPAAVSVRDDPAVAGALVGLARRLFERNARVRAQWPVSLRAGAPLDPSGVAVAVAHRDQRARVRDLLRGSAVTRGVTVDTANRLQGREYDVVLVWHPLSGRVDASAFHLDTGRLCVMTSRHRQACVIVGRGGLRDVLDDHLPTGLRPRGAHDDREHDGWWAHRRLLELVPAC